MNKCYLRVVNWEAFQHYGDRMPPWIKLHNTVLEDPVIASLPDHSKAHVFGLWLLASRLKNKIPNDAKFIGARINATRPVDVNSLIECKFLEHHPECLHDASNALAKCSTDKNKTRVEERREEERERTEPPPYVPPDIRTENALRGARWKAERDLLSLVGLISERTGQEAGDVMKQVTAYKRKSDDQLITGRLNPALLSEERLEKSVEDAQAWLASLAPVASA